MCRFWIPSCQKISEPEIMVIGIDNINNYYDISLKKKRLSELKLHKNFQFIKLDIRNRKKLFDNIGKVQISDIFHLAAQAGVRMSFTNPEDYFTNNLAGFFNILEFAKYKNIRRVHLASTSSVYGNQNHHLKKNQIQINPYLSTATKNVMK